MLNFLAKRIHFFKKNLTNPKLLNGSIYIIIIIIIIINGIIGYHSL